ncbi:MAG: zinc ribbon domain-containing protein [Candidatus Eremiobacteraeota bacterium]|nr:zinc ribbon domain-containing protein [Candidatus Eremiobacteraeota bacterium]
MAEKKESQEGASFLQSLRSTWVEGSPQEAEVVEVGPPLSRSPFLSDLIRARLLLKEGKGNADEVSRQINLMKMRLTPLMASMEQMAAYPEESLLFKGAVEKAQKALVRHKEALEDMDLFFKDGKEFHLDEGIKACQEATDVLYSSYEQFGALNAEISKKSCLQCGTKNPPEVKYCQKCGMEFRVIGGGYQVPLSPGESTKQAKDLLSGNVSIPTVFMAIYEELEKVKAGEVPDEVFVAHVQEVVDLFSLVKPQVEIILGKQLPQLGIDQSLKDSVAEVGRVLIDGIDEVLGGLDQLIRFTDRRVPKYLFDGWTAVMNGGQHILTAQTRFGEMLSQGAAMMKNMEVSGEEHIEQFTREETVLGEEED